MPHTTDTSKVKTSEPTGARRRALPGPRARRSGDAARRDPGRTVTSVEQRTVTTIRHEYVVPSPAAASDLLLATKMALDDMPEKRRAYDDAFTAEARDDEIVIWWPDERSGGR